MKSILNTCKNVSEGISACNFESRVFRPKDIQEKSCQTTQDAQETEGSNDSQQQNRLGINAVVWWKNKTVNKNNCWEPNICLFLLPTQKIQEFPVL